MTADEVERLREDVARIQVEWFEQAEMLVAERDTAHAAHAALVAGLRALCDELAALGDDWTPGVLRALLDRHAPEETT